MAVSVGADSPTAHYQVRTLEPLQDHHMDSRLTRNAIHLNQELGDGAIGPRPGPVQRGGIWTNTGKRYVRGIGDVDTEDADEFGYRLS
jgi:hypothetical protein